MAEVLFLELEVDSVSWLMAISMCRISLTSLSWVVACWPLFLVVDSFKISTWSGGVSGAMK